ncbi:MAG TPA: ParA family protein [Isosphaeraceae bacterium]|nr:ParA family protein [Isosphaeraceae bacterium]
MPIVTLLNQKGGVGKTSCTHHLSGTLSQMGRRILLLDADPQSSLTQGWWGPVVTRQLDPSATIAAVLRGDRPHPEQVIQPTGFDRIDLVPGSRTATSFNTPDPHLADTDSQLVLREFTREVADGYDLVLIDCPPNLHLCSWAALAASDFLVVPLQPEDYGAQGIADVLDSLTTVQSAGYPVELLGYLITMCSPRRTLHQLYEEQLRELYGSAVFTARVPMAPEFPEAISRRQTIAQYKPKGAPAKAMKALAEELLQRIANARAGGQETAA